MQHLPPARQVREQFAASYGRPCMVVARAPGRVNLIGEHTDYNDGWVLPLALTQATWVAAAPRSDALVHVCAADLDQVHKWPIEHCDSRAGPLWSRYVGGVITMLQRRGCAVPPCDLLIRSEVPAGAGLSSSAALELAVALACAGLAGVSYAPAENADLARAAEQKSVGVPCGIMDQYVSALARAGCALLLDCRSRTWEHVPLELRRYQVLVVHSGVSRDLASGDYAARQRECAAARESLAARAAGISALRDVSGELLEQHAGELDPTLHARARHVVSENERTLAAAAALRDGNVNAFAKLLSASHASLRDDFAVSCPAVDRLVERLESLPGVLGARMTGAGFGGCVLALVENERIDAVAEVIATEFPRTRSWPAQAGSGAELVIGR